MTSGFGKAVWGAIVVLALCAPVDAASGPGKGGGQPSGKLDQALRTKGRSGSSADRQTVIVTVKRGAKVGVRQHLEAAGGRVKKDHGIVSAMTVSVDARGLDALVNDPDVESISSDAAMSALGGGTSEPVVSSLQRTLALGNWFSGSSQTIATGDTVRTACSN